MDFVVASHWSMILPQKQAGTQQSDQSVIKTVINRARRLMKNEPAQSISYSNLLQIVGLKTNPSKLPIIHGYRATLDVQSSPDLQDLEPEVDPDLPELDSTILDVRPATFDASESVLPPRGAAVNSSMFRERLRLSQSCIERFDDREFLVVKVQVSDYRSPEHVDTRGRVDQSARGHIEPHVCRIHVQYELMGGRQRRENQLADGSSKTVSLGDAVSQGA
ncbi:hypothetical protein HYPSUDRAFT_77564 [Hypholoma sublateritium FD-334 SS-4]|uniref:Uncharacterized protein n=1 Tax=Hypholoma sublateritium (strain FD-334 SS-4) TaxID=945553 RepID=A0A0D2NZZ8_HYPSF|nr:hypothetical protein HYPSUDRAFT_77564 [Hypholoma sublateritium FD-334 SS-4]